MAKVTLTDITGELDALLASQGPLSAPAVAKVEKLIRTLEFKREGDLAATYRAKLQALAPAATAADLGRSARLHDVQGPGFVLLRSATRTAAEVEAEVDHIFDKLAKIPTAAGRPVSKQWLTVQFFGTEYTIGGADINSVINDELIKAGSDKRVFILKDERDRPFAFMGIPGHETTVLTHLGDARFVYLDRVLRGLGAEPKLAITDTLLHVFVVKDHVRLLAAGHTQSPSWDNAYKLAEQQKLFGRWLAMGEVRNEANLELVAELALAQQMGFHAMLGRYGFEVVILALQMMSDLRRDELYGLINIYADLFAIEQLLAWRATDSQKADRGFVAWKVMRMAPKEGTNSVSTLSSVISRLLLGASEIRAGDLHIDWDKLKENHTSFKQLMHAVVCQVIYHLYLDAYGRMPPAAAKARVVAEKQRSFAIAREHSGGLGDIGAHRILDGAVVIRALERAPSLLQSFASEMLVYQKWIDDWMRQHLGLTAAQLPFGIANYTALRPDYEAGPGAGVKPLEPDAAVMASWALPEVDFVALLRQQKGGASVHGSRPKSTAQPDRAAQGSHSPVTDSGHVATEAPIAGSPKKSSGDDPQAHSALVFGGGSVLDADSSLVGGVHYITDGGAVRVEEIIAEAPPRPVLEVIEGGLGELGARELEGEPVVIDEGVLGTSATNLVSPTVGPARVLRLVSKL